MSRISIAHENLHLQPIPTLRDLTKARVRKGSLLSGRSLLNMKWDPVGSGCHFDQYVRLSGRTVSQELDIAFNQRMQKWDEWVTSEV